MIEEKEVAQIKLGAYLYKVLMVNDRLVLNGEEVSAIVDNNDKTIRISGISWETKPPSCKLWCIIHEVLEAIKSIYWIDIEHKDLDRFAEGITDFLVHNTSLQIEGIL